MRCAVVGYPVSHSLSPAIHQAAYAELGLDWSYEAISVAPSELPEFVERLDRTVWRGLSVTMPHKNDAARLGMAGGKTENVAWTGVANTLVLDEHGIRAHNTDVTGYLTALRAHDLTALERAVVVGNGATARSAVVAAIRLGATAIDLWCRQPDRAAEVAALARRGGAEVTVTALSEVATAAAAEADVVLSTIPADEKVPAAAIAAAAPVIVDSIYDPWPTPVAAAAEEAGRTVVTGLELLAGQAVEQIDLFTGGRVGFDLALQAARDALAAR